MVTLTDLILNLT